VYLWRSIVGMVLGMVVFDRGNGGVLKCSE